MLDSRKSGNVYVGLLGLTGCGKSTLAGILRRLGFLHLEEPYSASPFLTEFYASGMKKGALVSQVFFLVRKWALVKAVGPLLEFFSVSVDPDVRVDIHMYVEALWKMGSLNEAEHMLYHMLAEALMRELPIPDLLIYCKVSPQTVFERVKARGRDFENTLTLEYLQLQMECLEEWLEEYPGPVLVLDMDGLNLTAEEGAQIALERVKAALQLLRKQ